MSRDESRSHSVSVHDVGYFRAQYSHPNLPLEVSLLKPFLRVSTTPDSQIIQVAM